MHQLQNAVTDSRLSLVNMMKIVSMPSLIKLMINGEIDPDLLN